MRRDWQSSTAGCESDRHSHERHDDNYRFLHPLPFSWPNVAPHGCAARARTVQGPVRHVYSVGTQFVSGCDGIVYICADMRNPISCMAFCCVRLCPNWFICVSVSSA